MTHALFETLAHISNMDKTVTSCVATFPKKQNSTQDNALKQDVHRNLTFVRQSL